MSEIYGFPKVNDRVAHIDFPDEHGTVKYVGPEFFEVAWDDGDEDGWENADHPDIIKA